MKFSIQQPVLAALLGLSLSNPSFAGDVNLHGFVRSAYDQSDSKSKYLETIDEDGDWGSTTAALNYATSINNEWSVAGQLFFQVAEGELSLDWAFATFTPTDSTAIRFGRQKYPLGLFSENIDIGITYPWVRPPQEIYRTEMGDEAPNMVIESFDGMSLVYSTGDDWEVSVQPFIGQYNYKSTGTVKNQRQMLGLKVEAVSDIVTLQAGYLNSKINIAGDLTDEGKTTVNIGASLEIDNFTAYAEYFDTEIDNSDKYDSTAGYLTFAYTIGKHQPSITFAQLEGQKATGAAKGKLDQTSTTLALSYHYNPSTSFKVQVQNIKPDDPTTGGLIAALPTGETSVNVYSFAMDVVF